MNDNNRHLVRCIKPPPTGDVQDEVHFGNTQLV
jgi:hypothetical protein